MQTAPRKAISRKATRNTAMTAASRCEVAQARDPRVRRTRQLLEDAFRALLKQQSFASISVQDVTERATVNRATFYAHYTDKEDLASSVLRNDLRHAMFTRFEELPSFTAENLVEMATLFFGFLESLEGTCPKTNQELPPAVGNTLQEELCKMLEHWLSQGNAHARVFPQRSKVTVATVLSWGIYGSALQWLRSSRREPASQVCREVVSILLPSL